MSAEKDKEDQGGGEKKRLTFIIVVRIGRKGGMGSLPVVVRLVSKTQFF